VNVPIQLRSPFVRLAPLSVAAFAAFAAFALFPACSAASPAGAHSEERAARAQERVSREAEKAIRSQEREAARNARQEREAGASASESGSGTPPSEPGTPSEPSSASAPRSQRGCRVSIEASTTRVTAGEAVTLSGALVCPASTSAADQQLPVYEREGSTAADSFSAAQTVATEADGSFELTSGPLQASTVFQIRDGRHRARVAVKVAPEVTITAAPAAAQASATGGQAHMQKRARATFTGTVSPAVTGALVALQLAYAATGERWHSVAYGHVAADGSYSLAHTFRTAGEVSVRAIVHLGAHYAPAASEPLSYEVPQPQNQQLSIQASADPLVAGQPLTISGVAAAGASQVLTLSAQTNGGSFVEVAKTTSEADGDYAFTQMPPQSTYYRVSDAGAESTVLFEGVSFSLASAPAPSTIQSGQQLTLSGTLTPAPAGQVVYLESEYTNGVRFHIIAVGSVGGESEYTIAHTFERAGTVVLRVTAPGDGQRQPSSSAPFTISVAG
jgi:hypothetical protein